VANILDEASRGLLRLTGLIALLAVVVVALTLFRRRWNGSDLVLVGAIVGGLAVVAILGFSLVALLLGIVFAVAVVLIVPRIVASKRQAAGAT
jgi:hypothetical protein